MALSNVTTDMKKAFNVQRKINSAVKKALAPIGKEVAKEMKTKVPVDTGALKRSITSKTYAKKGRQGIVIGVKSQYLYKGKIPNLYANKINAQVHFLALNKGRQLRERVAQEIRNILK